MTQRKPIYLESFALEDYRSIRRAEVSFLPGLNIIIGKNGSGKTSFLNAINETLLSNFHGGGLKYSKKELAISRDKRLNWSIYSEVNDDGRDIVHIDFSIDGTPEYSLKDYSGSDSISTAIITFLNGVQEIKLVSHGIPVDLPALSTTYFNTIRLKQKGLISSSDIFRLFGSGTEILRRIAIEVVNRLSKSNNSKNDFRNLFDFQSFNNSLIDSISTVIEELNETLPRFSEIEKVRLSDSFLTTYEPSSNSVSLTNLELEYFQHDKWHKYLELSDGGRRIVLIAISIGLNLDFVDNLILLEEPELGIHPHQLHKLMNFLKEESETKQIILTTHSPQVLDVLQPNELDRIIICEYDNEKGTILRHMTEDEKNYAQNYMKEQFLSDFWMYSGFNSDDDD